MTIQNRFLPGVALSKNKLRFVARSYRNEKPVYIGTYDTPEEAHEAYVKFTKEHPPGKNFEHETNGRFTSKQKRKVNNDLRGTWLYGL